MDQNNNGRYTTEVVLQGFNSTLCLLDPKGMSSGDAAASSIGAPPASSEEAGSFGSSVDFLDPDVDEIPF
ncbi:single-stranded DNA-binding protein [Anaplasma phagocytophilum]|nr:hypothetical protein [Anaplasma phagocytophilum]SBO33214.1 single-stranded DNA-binding protein [Anaplasma phagocytophilum]SBO33671.1 single-stranded DNA-binding protein [Anaplasma phagocytophilum]SBO33776.1 single-stranded DNA-binding protein [Anaplasma phagocytophilum]SCV63392.1 single-stranded DNA-binding protein [Anaplasma phagocytophilum]